MEVKNCITCGANLEAEENYVVFPCPSCGEEKIARCKKCRKLANNYECPNCGFRGP